MESRKSLRLMDQQHDVDFARLADGGVVTSDAPALHVPRKRGSSLSSSGIDVPGANSGQVISYYYYSLLFLVFIFRETKRAENAATDQVKTF